MNWLVEEGIGEDRAILFEDDRAVAAKLQWHGELSSGLIEDATLTFKPKGSARGRARFANGEEALADRLPQSAAEGSAIRLEVTRPRMGEKTRVKLAHCRPTDQPCRPAPTLAEKLGASVVRQFPGNDWEDIWGEAWDGIVAFPAGALQFSPTPAMTLIDVDGTLPLRDLALAACAPIGETIARMDLGGSIGIDFPTLQAKADRKAVDAALAQALAGWDHERTAMNGFGFVQIVARLSAPSLLHRLHFAPAGAAARLLMRRAEGVTSPGALLLTAHPAVISAISDAWRDELARRTGRQVRIEPDPALALESGFAQSVSL